MHILADLMDLLNNEHNGICEFVDSYFDDYKPSGSKVALEHLAKSLELLAGADVAYFCKGWEQARGCRIEHECARAYGIMIIEEGD